MTFSTVELYEKYEYYNKELFNDSLPKADSVTIEWDQRLKAAAGNCRVGRKHIKLSPAYHAKFPEEIESTLVHEMIHLSGVRGHGTAFEIEMNRINRQIPELKITRYATARATEGKWKYVCESCGREHTRINRLKNGGKSYRCKCTGTLKEMINETTNPIIIPAVDRPAAKTTAAGTKLPEGEKMCTKCGSIQPADKDHFYKDRSKKDGWDCWCKECTKRHREAKKAGR